MTRITVHPKPLHWISTLSAAPIAFTALPLASCLTLALSLLPLAAIPASAQTPKTDGYGTGVIADTVVHTPPHAKVQFTDTPPASPESELKESPANVHAEGLEDDYDNDTPTGWWAYNGETPAQVSSLLTANNARLIDISVDSVSPLLFTVTMVQNTGAYAKGWWWYYGLTSAQVSSYLSSHSARPISLKAYDIGNGQVRFAVVMIPNSGVDYKEYWWYYGESTSGLSSLTSTNHARLVTFDPYVVGSSTLYTGIMIANTGADAKGWWWYINASENTLANAVSQTKGRIFYLTASGNGNFDAILESCSGGCSEWWYYFGETSSQMVAQALQDGARLVNLSSYPGCGGLCTTGAMIDNSNAITTRVGNLIRNGGIAGTEGLLLERTNGTVLANLEDWAVYEPASSIKVVANLYAMTQVENGNIKMTTPITHYTNGPDSCPNPPVVSGTETLGVALREMMYHSDNARTREITDHFTDAAINAYAHSLGMTNTGFYHYVGCGGPTPDQFSLDNAAILYDGVANQTLLNSKTRGIFYSDMAGRAQFESEGYDWTGIWDSDIPNIINQVAPAGTTAAQKAAYQNEMNLAYKAGNYLFCQNSNCTDVTEDIAITGWFQLPVCGTSSTTYDGYMWGIFFSNEPNSGYYTNKVTPTDSNFTTAKSELMREQIQAGMASCKGKSFDVMSYSPGDLVFPLTTLGKSSAVQTITVTNRQPTAVTGLSVSIFGDFSETNNCPASLASGASCTISVKFTPTIVSTERTGAAIVSDNGTGQPQTIQLTGSSN
jgi:hypothetical protein